MTSPPPSPGTQPSPGRRGPVPLAVAAVLVVLEALTLVVLGVAEVFWLSGSRLTMGLTTAVFFLVYGGGLAWCGWQLYRLQSWARAPVVLAQLIQLPVAWSFRGGSTTPVAAVLVLVALAVLVGVLHPASLRAVEDRTEPV